ncbi:uncharacterized protein LOC124940672 [Impatiens glandulifera]|uniref:uncharacterized protein LOC124940672 n=1 Tax=Impatiens glandulifera TaxID=253017 RepID=UPI001FB10C12|nr:uncharacterized protein LOC124940672 [Impatiens glandulifera]
MGNCVRKGSSERTSRDIKSPMMVPETQFSGKTWGLDEKEEKGDDQKIAGREIKVKITKKQLEELLGKVEVQGLPLQLLLAELIISSQVQHDQDQDQDSDDHQRSWRPTLQSIPE